MWQAIARADLLGARCLYNAGRTETTVRAQNAALLEPD